MFAQAVSVSPLNCFSGEFLRKSFLATKQQFSCLINRSRERKDNSEENYNGSDASLSQGEKKRKLSPVEILSTEDVSVPEETLLVQLVLTVVTSDTVNMPLFIQHCEEESLQNWLPTTVAAGKRHHGDSSV